MKITHITVKLHKQKHTLLSTFAVENNNEQQSQIHVKLRNFGNPARENPNVGKPNKREILLELQEEILQQ
jgi:hypothetical protein